MAMFFGMNIKTREEREKEYKEYTLKIFPYGEQQRDRVRLLLSTMLPKEDPVSLLMYYIQLKEKLIDHPELTVFDAEDSLQSMRFLLRSLEMRAVVYAILEADQSIGESLSYPSIQQLRSAADIYMKQLRPLR